MTTIALLGAGNVARILALHRHEFHISAVFDRHEERQNRIALQTGCMSCSTFDELLAEEFDLLVEVASIAAVRQYAIPALNREKDLVVLSSGGLMDQNFRQKLIQKAGERGCKIRVPSGALFGLDNMKIGRISSFDRLLLKTTKSPQSLNLEVSERKCLFKGKALDAIRKFPHNINVAATLVLASDHELDVELWVDPETKSNTHEILLSGAFGELKALTRNVPSPENPATSYLAALSIITLLNNFHKPLIVGT